MNSEIGHTDYLKTDSDQKIIVVTRTLLMSSFEKGEDQSFFFVFNLIFIGGVQEKNNKIFKRKDVQQRYLTK